MKHCRILISLGVLCSVTYGLPAAAQVAEENRARQLLENFVNNVQSMSARFEQQLVSAEDIVVDESSGTLEIQRPGNFRWTYAEPYEQILVADGLNVWTYDVDLEQVTVKPQSEALGNTPALLLGGSSEVLDEFTYSGNFVDGDTEWVLLVPRSDENGFTRVQLGFTDGMLSRMIFSDNLEQSTLIALFEVAAGVEIDPQRFVLTPPDHVDLVGEPLLVDP